MSKEIKTVTIITDMDPVKFTFYPGFSKVPVADFGDILSTLFCAKDCVVSGDSKGSPFTITLDLSQQLAVVVACSKYTFTERPEMLPEHQLSAYRHFQVSVINKAEMKQLAFPFVSPDGLTYDHSKAAWGLRLDKAHLWVDGEEDEDYVSGIYDAISALVDPVLRVVSMF